MKTPNTFVGSYAPSFGRSSITDLEKRKLESNIKNFDYITVREPSMVNILSPYTKKKIHVVCDPIFLLSKKEWFELLDSNLIKTIIHYERIKTVLRVWIPQKYRTKFKQVKKNSKI